LHNSEVKKKWRHDIQHNGNQDNATRHNYHGKAMEKCDTQQNNEKSDTQHNIMPSGIMLSAIMLNVVAPKIAILGFKNMRLVFPCHIMGQNIGKE
jgi:hypothetical protein